MNLSQQALDFVLGAGRAKTLDELGGLLAGVTRKLGFDCYALVHHVNIMEAGSNAVFLHNYPAGWARTVHQRRYLLDDPVPAVCRDRDLPFSWSDMPRLITMTKRQAKVMSEAKKAGLSHGFTVPIHMPGEMTGSCTFCTTGNRPFPPQSMPVADYVGRFAFEAARQLVRNGAARVVRPVTPARSKLTRRELDCALLAGRGLSDGDAAQILGIPEKTVEQHVAEAMRKYGVVTRVELIVRALFDSELMFQDLIDVERKGVRDGAARRHEQVTDEPAPMSKLGEMFFGKAPALH